ncbi:MAG: undecaprenyl-diphosphatase [Candidatus Tectimicrobiota bacterium]|nr:MAG: undecaprenyl-diphosphatase [Candidatus Tectomicrobia bacterium]
MTTLQALLLGVLQGLTEFLPVSSSGHLVLLQAFFGLREPALLFDVFVHVATLGAVFCIYRRDIWAMVVACPGLPAAWRRPLALDGLALAQYRRLGLLVLLANVPTALLGLVVATALEELFATPWAVGLALLASGGALWSLRYTPKSWRDLDTLGISHALMLGLVQGVAVIPGLSRSGWTIAAALWCGLQREAAARFSFLMAIPAIAGAALLTAVQRVPGTTTPAPALLLGMAGAFGVGYLALRFLLRVVSQGQFWRFAPYCWLVGLGALLFSR